MKTRALFAKIATVSLLGAGLMSQGVWAQGNGGNQPSFVPGRILVKFKDGVSDGQARGLLAGRNALSTNVIPGIGVHIVQLPPNANEQAEANAFKGLKDVEFAEVDAIVAPSSIIPNDPYYASEWHLTKMSASNAWSTTTGSTIIIAVVDTGVDGNHQDLSTKMVGGWNVVDNNSTTSDISTHGTPSAGTAAGATNNGLGTAGVCWGCKIMPVRVTDDTYGFATSSNVAAGIAWAASHGARIAVVGYALSDDPTVTSAAQSFYNGGGIVIMPAGNDGAIDSNQDNPYALTIGSTDFSDVIFSWSNRGNNLDLVAPGCNPDTTVPNNGYAQICGTSMSAAMVAGAAGLVLSVNSALTPSQVTCTLQHATDDLGNTGWDSTYGWGRINALKAVTNSPCTGGSTTPTTTVLGSNLNPSTSGQLVTFTATVTPSAATGTVTFLDGTTTLGSGTLSAGLATFATSSLSVTTHSITATYNSNSSYSASTSSVISQVVSSTTKTNTTTGVTSMLNPSASGQSVTFKATVSPSTSTGTVTFLDGATPLGSGTLSGGLATFAISTLSSGGHSITAAYGGDTNYNGSTSGAMMETVTPPAPVITSSLSASGTQNTAFGYQISGTNSPTSYGASGLPSGLSVNTATGIISGAPSVSGTFSVTISATNSGGTGSAILALMIGTAVPPPAPVITSSLSATGSQNTAFSYQIAATNSPASYGASGLPAGLSVNTSSGSIFGTPTGSGTFNITISATNSGGTGSAVLTLTISPAAPPPVDFSISASPNSINTKAGTTAAYTVKITGLNGFASTVSFSLTGATGSFSPATVTGSGSTVLSVSPPKGSYTLTITGTSGGLIHSTSVALRVH